MASLQRAPFTDLPLVGFHVAQGWERPELGQASRWQEALQGIASENHAGLPKVGKGKWSRSSYTSGDTVQAREAPSFQTSAGHLSQELTSHLIRINFQSHSPLVFLEAYGDFFGM